MGWIQEDPLVANMAITLVYATVSFARSYFLRIVKHVQPVVLHWHFIILQKKYGVKISHMVNILTYRSAV